MGDVQEVQLHIRVPPASPKDEIAIDQPQLSKLKQWSWWLMVILNTSFVLAGSTVATLLGRFYYDQGGNSKWMATVVQSAGSPLLLPMFIFFSSRTTPSVTTTATIHPSFATIAIIYVALGLIIASDNLMYSYGLLYLPVSTYSLVCATQLAFNAVFSYFLNSQKFTALIFNSVVLLTFSAALLGVRSEGSTDVSKAKYPLGFMLTLGASATFSLILSLMQLTFQRVLKKETFSVVLEMQMFTNIVAACASVLGLFASGEWRGLKEEMEGFEKGQVVYIMTLVWTAISWQVSSVGTLGLIYMASSLFSNVISTLALPLVPIFAVVFFHDSMDGVKVLAMLIAIWGSLSYIYQHSLDDSKAKRGTSDTL